MRAGKPTEKQREILIFINDYKKTYGYSPTAKEIADHFQVVRNAIVCQLNALQAKGLVRVTPKVTRSLVSIWVDEASDLGEPVKEGV